MLANTQVADPFLALVQGGQRVASRLEPLADNDPDEPFEMRGPGLRLLFCASWGKMGLTLPLEGMVMDQETQIEMEPEAEFCPECGAEESGYFCRSCGSLLRGEDEVLCPRCHQVVPSADYCNQCGQSLSGVALNLRQLALAGDDFWVSASSSMPVAQPTAGDVGLWEPDDTVFLADADLPDWLVELPTESAPPEVQSHVYPSLEPIQKEREFSGQGRFFTVVVLLLGLFLLALVVTVVYLLAGGGA